MKIIISLFISILFIFAILYADYRMNKHFNKNESLRAAFSKMKNWLSLAYQLANDSYLRSRTFDLSLSPKPFEDQVMGLHACKYFKYMECIPINRDVACFRFTILGISPEYLGEREKLGEIIEQLLRDAYLERFSKNFYPYVHLTYFEGNRIEIWVARNELGNHQILNKAIDDLMKNEPFEGDLEDG